jgi:hypothetical protein
MGRAAVNKFVFHSMFEMEDSEQTVKKNAKIKYGILKKYVSSSLANHLEAIERYLGFFWILDFPNSLQVLAAYVSWRTETGHKFL